MNKQIDKEAQSDAKNFFAEIVARRSSGNGASGGPADYSVATTQN